MRRYLDRRIGHYALLVACGIAQFMVNLGGPSLWDVDEGRNAGAMIEMIASHDWIVPTFNGVLRDHKPALLYWLQVAACQVFGIGEFAARLPSALAALFAVLLIYELGRLLFDKRTGLLAGIIVSSTVMIGGAAHFANPDALLNLFTVAAFWAFWRGWSRSGKIPFAACGLMCGLAVLAKGPVGLLLPSTAFFLFLLWNHQLRAYLTPRVGLGVVTFSLVALPWYILVGVETKAQFLWNFFLQHNYARFQGAMENHSGGAWYYLVVLLAGFAPWSAFLGLTLWYGFWSAIRQPWDLRSWCRYAADRKQIVGGSAGCVAERSPDSSPLPELRERRPRVESYRLLWCWLAVYLVFFSLAATKLPNYILPVAAPLAILTARLLERWRTGTLPVADRLMRLGVVFFGMIGVAVALALIVLSGRVPLPAVAVPRLAGAEYWAAAGLVLPLGAAAAWWAGWRGRRGAAVAWLSGAAVVFLAILFAGAGALVEPLKPARALALESNVQKPEQDLLILNYRVEHLASLNFYCRRGVTYCSSDEQVIERMRSPQPIYLFLPSGEWERLRPALPVPCRAVARHADLRRDVAEVVVVTNQ